MAVYSTSGAGSGLLAMLSGVAQAVHHMKNLFQPFDFFWKMRLIRE